MATFLGSGRKVSEGVGEAALVMGRSGPRVLIIVQNLPLPMDRRVWLQCGALRDAGYDVSVICPKGPGDPSYAVLEGVRLYKYRPPPPARGPLGYGFEFLYCWLATAALTVRVLARGRISVVQACNPPDTYFALAWCLKTLGVRFIYDQHDLCPEVYRSRFGRDDGVLLWALNALERLTYRTADHVIAVNESYRSVALSRGGKAPGDVTIVRTGPDLKRLRPVPPRPELKHGRPYLCCYLGVMGPQDGVDVVVRAAHAIVHEMGRDDVHFALLGFGDCFEELHALTRQLRLKDHVTFTGRADDAMIAQYLSTADIGLSPDPKDPFNDVSTMNKTMEYMVFSLPVVAFDLTETRVSAGEAAVYVSSESPSDYAKAILALVDDPEERQRRGTNGRERIEATLAWAHQRGHYEGVYRLPLVGGTRADS